MRQPLAANLRRQTLARGASVPAPVGGWDAVSPLAAMDAKRAVVLDNWFPQPGWVEPRKGDISWATGMGSDPVETLMVYNALAEADSKLFAVTGGEIWDATANAAATTTGEDTLTNDRWQWVNFTTPGGKFLWICNGADAPRHFNGSAWAQPSITGISASDIINVNVHKSRLWFVLNESTTAAYLATNAIAGAATTFELGNVFRKGGHLVAMGTWTRDGGAGSDDLAVFISSEGECAVYQGTDPDSADTWQLVGVFELGPPIGRRCFTKVGGDLALINIDGVLPLSKGLGSDRAAAARIAITANINNAINSATKNWRGNFGWELVPYPKGTRAILNVPLQEGALQHQYVMNTLTGAWCRFTGQNYNTMVVFKGEIYGGGNDGKVYKSDTASSDHGSAINCIGQCAYNYFKTPGQLKNFLMLQPLLTTDAMSRPALGISTDFRDNAVLGTPTAAEEASALWDQAQWDVDVFAVENRSVTDWVSVTGEGQSGSIHFNAQTNSTGTVTMQLNGFNLLFEVGEFM
jgi:hypothetical protein